MNRKLYRTAATLGIVVLLYSTGTLLAAENQPVAGGTEELANGSIEGSTELINKETDSRQLNSAVDKFRQLELDSFIDAEKGKRKIIKMMAPVSFDAIMKRLPEEREMNYVYTAMQLSGVENVPRVNHRMFVESDGGRIIPVYVEENAVQKLNSGLKAGDKARFMGYHVYSYSKGPAILVVDFQRVP